MIKYSEIQPGDDLRIIGRSTNFYSIGSLVKVIEVKLNGVLVENEGKDRYYFSSIQGARSLKKAEPECLKV